MSERKPFVTDYCWTHEEFCPGQVMCDSVWDGNRCEVTSVVVMGVEDAR